MPMTTNIKRQTRKFSKHSYLPTPPTNSLPDGLNTVGKPHHHRSIFRLAILISRYISISTSTSASANASLETPTRTELIRYTTPYPLHDRLHPSNLPCFLLPFVVSTCSTLISLSSWTDLSLLRTLLPLRLMAVTPMLRDGKGMTSLPLPLEHLLH